MAKIDKLPIFGRMRGKAADLVVKRRQGKYYVSAPPHKEKPPTEKQLDHQKRFARAIRYAKRATSEDSPTREIYIEEAEGKRPPAHERGSLGLVPPPRDR